ncbi:hypothetical protein [Mangrovimonas futianensis]|uniref:hypothetical protein n=1 Tax=Mangrovimonas futianensis TaxID=2895523 RepID=UPI001E2CCE7F|nr:hypothetical protein [Mangrovimonas futianensis]MCF1420406.1 hypothetical protein [Mangrovimonas futianensis]
MLIENSSNRVKDSLAFELCKMYGLDQGVRESSGFQGKWNFIFSVDSLNFDRAMTFIKKYGYPTESLVGSDNYKIECVSSSFFAILLHNPHRIVNEREHYKTLLNEVHEKRLSPSEFANIIDKYYWIKRGNNKRVLVGSDFGKPCLETKEETNQIRKEIGLPLLQDSEFINCPEKM